MRALTKFTGLSLFAFGLSGCSFTQSVAQIAYDNKAESDCRSQFGDPDSIHTRVKSSCNGQSYDPDADGWNPNAILKQETDNGIDVEDVTPPE